MFTESALTIEQLLANEQKEGIFVAGPVFWELPGGFCYGDLEESKGASGFQKPKGLLQNRLRQRKVLKSISTVTSQASRDLGYFRCCAGSI